MCDLIEHIYRNRDFVGQMKMRIDAQIKYREKEIQS